jgi:hypothetical protein
MKVIIFIIFLALINCNKDKIDLSTPEETIYTYLEAENLATINNCYYPGIKLENHTIMWTDYRILEKKNTQLVGKNFGLSDGTTIEISKDDIEIVAELHMDDPGKQNPWTKFWFLLKKYNGNWLILEQSYISDDNYPSYD